MVIGNSTRRGSGVLCSDFQDKAVNTGLRFTSRFVVGRGWVGGFVAGLKTLDAGFHSHSSPRRSRIVETGVVHVLIRRFHWKKGNVPFLFSHSCPQAGAGAGIGIVPESCRSCFMTGNGIRPPASSGDRPTRRTPSPRSTCPGHRSAR